MISIITRQQSNKVNKLYLKHKNRIENDVELEEKLRKSIDSYITNDQEYTNHIGHSYAFSDGAEWALKKLTKWDLITFKKDPVFLIIFHNHVVNEIQTFRIRAKNKHNARHMFWDKYTRTTKFEIKLIEQIYPLEGWN